jgi:hypothetical protein
MRSPSALLLGEHVFIRRPSVRWWRVMVSTVQLCWCGDFPLRYWDVRETLIGHCMPKIWVDSCCPGVRVRSIFGLVFSPDKMPIENGHIGHFTGFPHRTVPIFPNHAHYVHFRFLESPLSPLQYILTFLAPTSMWQLFCTDLLLRPLFTV